jgi:diguanylate cyclase (GGDEF)-like protein
METLRVFHEVARALTSSLEVDSLLRAIMAKMEDFFGPEQWSLLLLDQETQELYYALSSHGVETSMRDVRLPLDKSIAGYVVGTGQPLVVPDVHADAEWSRFAMQHPELHLQSIACLPIRHGGRTLAVLQLNNSKLDLLPDSSVTFLLVLCDYAAIALENARQVQLIHDLSITDDCTGLFNGRHLQTLLRQEIERAGQAGRVVPIRPQHFSLLFLDLDHFKSVNDTHGHLVGSGLLAEIGGVIKRTLAPDHAGFRYGGDEFVALLRGLDKPAALEFAHRLRNELNGTRFLTATGQSVGVTASFGLATFPEDGDQPDGIIRSADAMMYAAKKAGRDRIEVADGTQSALPISKISRHS